MGKVDVSHFTANREDFPEEYSENIEEHLLKKSLTRNQFELEKWILKRDAEVLN
jgi:hypothetical protein